MTTEQVSVERSMEWVEKVNWSTVDNKKLQLYAVVKLGACEPFSNIKFLDRQVKYISNVVRNPPPV